MEFPQAFQAQSADPEATLALGQRIGARLVGGDVLGLSGDLGTGKTTFVRGLAGGMGITDPVSSPTYTLMHEYQGRGLSLHHYDAWMEGRQKAILAEGGAGLLDGDWACVVEWAGRVQEFLPGSTLWIEFSHVGEESRGLVFRGATERWVKWLEGGEIQGLTWVGADPGG